MEQKIIVSESVGERLDIYLSSKLDITRSAVKNLIEDGKVLVNNKSVKAGYKVLNGDEIFVEKIIGNASFSSFILLLSCVHLLNSLILVSSSSILQIPINSE